MRTQSLNRVVMLMAGGALMLPGAAAAQWNGLSAAAGPLLQSYSFSDAEAVGVESATLLTLPVSATVALTPSLEFGLSAAWARGSVQRTGGQEGELSGLLDTEVRLTMALMSDRIRLTALALLPTGQAELDAGEADVAGVVASDALPFAVSNWGSGGGVGASVAVATPLGRDMALGVSGGYVVGREFDPLAETSFAYRPGNQLQLRAAVDRTFGSSAKASLQVTFLHYGNDELAGESLYRPGDRLQALGSYAFAVGAAGSGVAYGGYLRRQEGEYTAFPTVTPAENLFQAGMAFRIPATASLLLTPAVDVRLLGSATGGEEGYVMAVGGGAEFPVGQAVLVPTGRLRLGSITVVSGAESRFTGIEIGLDVRTRTVRP